MDIDFKRQASSAASTLVNNQSVIGLGAGASIAYMIDFLSERMQKGLHVTILTSSSDTKKILLEKNIPVVDTSGVSSIDMYFDGCDQFDKELNALKSGGGIHTQEKLLASMAKEFILVGDDSKYVNQLDTKFPLVIEFIPEARGFVEKEIKEVLDVVRIVLRMDKLSGKELITKNKNYLFDVWVNKWPELSIINPTLKNITGVLETSLFYRMADKAVIAGAQGIRVIKN